MKNLLLELENLKEASRPSVERKFDENGVQSTGIPVSLFIFLFVFKLIPLKFFINILLIKRLILRFSQN